MAIAGNSYTVRLLKTHINWGTFRYTSTREPIYGETYIPIPSYRASSFRLYNSNFKNGDILGINIFNFDAYIGNDIYSSGLLKSSGCIKAHDIYAKNLSGYGNLKLLSPWIYTAGIEIGDSVNVLFTSPTDIELRKV